MYGKLKIKKKLTFTRSRTIVARPVLIRKSAKPRSEKSSNPALSKMKSIVMSDVAALDGSKLEGVV